jgi:hypothetical protein
MDASPRFDGGCWSPPGGATAGSSGSLLALAVGSVATLDAAFGFLRLKK